MDLRSQTWHCLSTGLRQQLKMVVYKTVHEHVPLGQSIGDKVLQISVTLLGGPSIARMQRPPRSPSPSRLPGTATVPKRTNHACSSRTIMPRPQMPPTHTKLLVPSTHQAPSAIYVCSNAQYIRIHSFHRVLRQYDTVPHGPPFQCATALPSNRDSRSLD